MHTRPISFTSMQNLHKPFNWSQHADWDYANRRTQHQLPTACYLYPNPNTESSGSLRNQL